MRKQDRLKMTEPGYKPNLDGPTGRLLPTEEPPETETQEIPRLHFMHDTGLPDIEKILAQQ